MFAVLEWHGVEYPFLFDNFTFWTLLLTIAFVQRKSFKCLFLWKHIIGGSGNRSLNVLFIFNIFHCFFTASFTFGKVRLEVKANRILYLGSLFCVSMSSLFLSNIFYILSHMSSCLYPLSMIFFRQNVTIGFEIGILGTHWS